MTSCHIEFLAGPLPPVPAGTFLSAPGMPQAGALISFEGVVRPLEDGRPLAALEYEAYEPMASRQLTQLAQRIQCEHGLLAIYVLHSRGRVEVGQISFRLVVAARHRREGIAALAAFIDDLKRLVPIWKTPVWPTHPTPAPHT